MNIKNRILAALAALMTVIVALPATAQVYTSTDRASFDKLRKGIVAYNFPFTSIGRLAGDTYSFDTDPSSKVKNVTFSLSNVPSRGGLYGESANATTYGKPLLLDLGGDLSVSYGGPVLALLLAVQTSQTINYTVNNISKSVKLTAGQVNFLGFDNGGNSSSINVKFDLSSCDKLAVLGFETAVPEAATWAMMMIGFGAVGGSLRRRRTATARLRLA